MKKHSNTDSATLKRWKNTSTKAKLEWLESAVVFAKGVKFTALPKFQWGKKKENSSEKIS